MLFSIYLSHSNISKSVFISRVLMRKFLFFFAATGWTLALIVHLLSLSGFDLSKRVPFIWLLHLGIFVVWIPVVLDWNKNEYFKTIRQSGIANRMNPFVFFKVIFRYTPTWLTIIAIAGFYYAIVNFMLFMFFQHGTPAIKDGQFVLQNHGQLITTLTEKEYHHYKANEVRAFSGHWIAFYGIAMAVLFPFKRLVQNPQDQNK